MYIVSQTTHRQSRIFFPCPTYTSARCPSFFFLQPSHHGDILSVALALDTGKLCITLSHGPSLSLSASRSLFFFSPVPTFFFFFCEPAFSWAAFPDRHRRQNLFPPVPCLFFFSAFLHPAHFLRGWDLHLGVLPRALAGRNSALCQQHEKCRQRGRRGWAPTEASLFSRAKKGVRHQDGRTQEPRSIQFTVLSRSLLPAGQSDETNRMQSGAGKKKETACVFVCSQTRTTPFAFESANRAPLLFFSPCLAKTVSKTEFSHCCNKSHSTRRRSRKKKCGLLARSPCSSPTRIDPPRSSAE